MEHKHGGVGGQIARDPPTGQLRLAGCIVAEANGLELEVLRRRCQVDGAGRVQDQLPLRLEKQDANRKVRAK